MVFNEGDRDSVLGDDLAELLLSAGVRIVQIRDADPENHPRRSRISGLLDQARLVLCDGSFTDNIWWTRANAGERLVRFDDFLQDVRIIDNERMLRLSEKLPVELIVAILKNVNRFGIILTAADLPRKYRPWPIINKCTSRSCTNRVGYPYAHDSVNTTCPDEIKINWVSESRPRWPMGRYSWNNEEPAMEDDHPELFREFTHQHRNGYRWAQCRHPVEICKGHYESAEEWMYASDIADHNVLSRRRCSTCSYDSNNPTYQRMRLGPSFGSNQVSSSSGPRLRGGEVNA